VTEHPSTESKSEGGGEVPALPRSKPTTPTPGGSSTVPAP
jgi:hypothetical protein